MKVPSNPKSAKRRLRTNGGSGLVELCTALIFGIPLLLASTDLGVIALGAYTNDCVCRDAARAAAAGAPAATTAPAAHQISPNDPPYDRAVAVINDHLPTALPIKVSDQPELSETLNYLPTPDVGGSVDGAVSVKTSVVVLPPFILAQYFGAGGLTLTSRHTDSYTYVVPRQPEKP
jgi:hypothetical protein